MKTPKHFLFAVACGFLLAFAGSGCTGGKSSKVDVPAQIANLKSDNAETKQNACVALGDAGPKAAAAVQPLTGLLKDPDPLVRRLAAYALGKIGSKAASAVPALKEALRDPDPTVISAVAGAIEEIDPKAAAAAGLKPGKNAMN